MPETRRYFRVDIGRVAELLGEDIPGDVLTRQQIQDATGYSQTGAALLIRRMMAQGNLEFAGKKQVINVHGGKQWVPTYRLVGATLKPVSEAKSWQT